MKPKVTRTNRLGLVGLGLVVALLLVAAPASAQIEANLELKAGSPSGEAEPNGDPATVPLTINYDCLGIVQGDISLSASVTEGGGSASLADETFAAKTLPDCTPGTPVEETTTLSYMATAEAMAEVPIIIEVIATATGTAGDEVKDSVNVTVKAGPLLDVTLTPTVTDFEVAAGESFDVLVNIQSNSNTMVMAMSNGFEGFPAGWIEPDVVPMNIPSPLAEGDGSSAFDFTIAVPPDAEPGEHAMTFKAYVHTLTTTTLELNEDIPINLKVLPAAAGNGSESEDTGESPVPGAVPFLAAALGLVALARRRL